MVIEEVREENVGDQQWRLETEAPNGDPLQLLIECEELDQQADDAPGTAFREFLERERTTH